MKLCFNVVELRKATGIDYGIGKKTQRIAVQGKHGVYYRNQTVGRKQEISNGGKHDTAEENITSKDGRFTVGDVVSFSSNGKELQGKVLGGKGDTIVIDGKGEASGIRYTVNVSDVKDKVKNADGTIPASKFNANDYKKSFTDPNATNDYKGYQYIYDSLGETGKEAAAITIKRLEEQDSRMKRSGDTKHRYQINGEYTPERTALHNDIINSILSSEKITACKPKNGENPKFVMFGGRGGSGKSWFTDKERAAKEGRQVMFDADKFLVLDADALKEYIPEYEGWNTGEVHEESSDLNKMIKAKAFELGLNIIIDGTMNYNGEKPDKVRNEMLEAKDKGYSLEAHYMFLPVQESTKRAINRFKTKKGDFSGCLVPMKILMGMQDNEKSFDSVKDIVDDWSFRDNQGSSGPKLVSRKGV